VICGGIWLFVLYDIGIIVDHHSLNFLFPILIDYVIFEDTKGVIRIRKMKKDRQHNGQKKKDKHRSTKHTLKNKVCCVYTIVIQSQSVFTFIP
jgi:hypothetical protein